MQESMASSFEITCKHPSPKTREKVIRTNENTNFVKSRLLKKLFSETSLETNANIMGHS